MVSTPIPPIADADRYYQYNPVVATADFAFPFPYFSNDTSDVKVFVNGLQVTAFSVLSLSLGSIATATLPISDLFVRLDVAVTGKVELYGAIRPRRTAQATAAYGTRDFNYAFSYVIAALREMWSQFTRAIQVPAGENAIVLPSAAARAQKVLGFDSSGNPAALDPASGGVVGTSSIIDGAVTTPKLADGNVTLAKLAAALLNGTAGALIQWAAGPKYPAGDGSNITNVAASSLVAGATIASSPAQTDLSTKVATTANVKANRGWDVWVEDQKTSGTSPGNSVASAWTTRDLNTIVTNLVGATISANKVTLPDGTWEIEADAPFFCTDAVRIRIYNVTDAAIAGIGPAVQSNHNYFTTVSAMARCIVTIAAPKEFRLDYYAAYAFVGGLGMPLAGSGVTEVYSRFRAKRIG
jgi:hypothetical protein